MLIVCIKETGLQRDKDNIGVGYSHYEIVCTITDTLLCVYLDSCSKFVLFNFNILLLKKNNQTTIKFNCVIFAGTSG